MDVYDKMKKVIDNNYIRLIRELDPGLIAAHMKSVLSQGEADHYDDITLPTKTRPQQCVTLLGKITLHDKWWIHLIDALEKCGKVSLASPFKDELKRIESENQKLSKGKRHTTAHNRHRSRSSLTDADSASPSASPSAALRCPRRHRDADDLSSGSSRDNDPTGLPVRVYQPQQTGATTCGRNLACGRTDQSDSMEQNGPVPRGPILKRKDDIYLDFDSSDNSQRTYTLDTPLRQAPATLVMSVYRHLDSKTSTGNYEDLAGELGFNLEDLRNFVNTESVIQRFSQVHPKKGTFRVLMEALHKMGRRDVLEDIKQHTGLVCHVKEQDDELHDTSTSTRTLNRHCERMLGKVADKCDDVPEDPGVIPSDVTHAAKKTVHDEIPENRVIEDDLATAVHLEEGVMAMNEQKKEEYNGEHDKRMTAYSMSEIPGNIDDGAKPPPFPKVLPGNSGEGERPKLCSTYHDQRDIYLPPDDINDRPTRKQLSHGRSNGIGSTSLGEIVSDFSAPNREDTEHGGQTLVPTQSRQLSQQCANIPNFDAILPTNMENKEKGDCRENGTSESEFANCFSLSQYSENASVHDRLAQEVLEKEHLRDGNRLELNGSDGTSKAAPDNTAIDHHGNHTRADIGPIQGLELGKTQMNLGPCLSIEDSEFESSSASTADEEMVTGNGSEGNCSGLVNQQISAGEERKKPPFLPSWKTLFFKLSLQLHDCMYTNTLPNWHT